MTKWIVILGFAALMCFLVLHFFPGVQAHVFNIGNFSVNGTMLCGLAFVVVGHKMVRGGK